MEQGEVAPYLASFPNPNLQATTSRLAAKWPGKGLLQTGDMGLNTSSSATGWQLNALVASQSVAITASNHNAVADPNGNMTATTWSCPALTSSQYSYAGNQTVEVIGGSSPYTTHHTQGVWLRGHVGGEQVTLQGNNLTAAVKAPAKTVTLTTSWAYYEADCIFAAPINTVGLILVGCGGGGSAVPAQTFDVWGPNFK